VSSEIRSQIHIPIQIIRSPLQRFIIIGVSEQGRMLVVAHTDDGEVVRIISAREATSGERKTYEED